MSKARKNTTVLTYLRIFHKQIGMIQTKNEERSILKWKCNSLKHYIKCWCNNRQILDTKHHYPKTNSKCQMRSLPMAPPPLSRWTLTWASAITSSTRTTKRSSSTSPTRTAGSRRTWPSTWSGLWRSSFSLQFSGELPETTEDW